MNNRHLQWTRRWGIAAILLVALAVRLYELTYHSLWYDEVVSAFWAAQPLARVWQVGLALVEDKHPPLYYLALHGWTALFGQSDFALRSLGALIGALAVLPAYGIGRRLGGRVAGLLAALLLALNPFLVWYSQESRMFMPAATLLLAGLYGVLSLWPAEKVAPSWRTLWGPFLVIVLSFTAALYTYLFSAFLLPVAGLWLLILWWTLRDRPGAGRRLLAGLAALVTVGLLFLPLAQAAWSVSSRESAPGQAFANLPATAAWLADAYLLGRYGRADQLEAWMLAGLALLALVGLSVGSTATRRSGAAATSLPGGLLLALWLLAPLGLGGLLQASNARIFGETRYFIFLAPALCLAMGRGLAWLWAQRRAAGLLGLAFSLGVTLLALPANWAPENRREAWREAAAYVEAHAGPRDAVLLYIDYVAPAFDRYFQMARPIFFPITGPVTDVAQIDDTLQGFVDVGWRAVWLVQSHHQDLSPDNLVTGWFAARYPLITEQYPAGISVQGFATRYRLPNLPREAAAGQVEARWGELRLLSCLPDPGPSAAQDDLYHPPSGWVHVTTYWTVDEALAEDVQPVARLVDAGGNVWGEALQRPNDAFHLWPTSRWTPGEVVRADQDVNLNPITPAGRYRLVIGRPGRGAEALCGEVEIR